MRFKFCLISIFLGSVFLTSEKFVDAESDIKYYFTTLSVLLLLVIFLFSKNKLQYFVDKNQTLAALKVMFVVGVAQAAYGISQYMQILPSNHHIFTVTGSFDNPAGFSAILSLLYPIGLYWCLKSRKLEQRIVFFLLGIVIFAIVLSGSRTGILSVLVSSLVIFVFELDIFQKIKNLKHYKLIFLASFLLIVAIAWGLYAYKVDSANGRILIWKVSAEMIKDKPLLGFGIGGFQANYMDYQANYFAENSDSKLSLLADNTKHPFNEFVLMAVNYGIIGLLFYLSLLAIVARRMLKSELPYKTIYIGIYFVFILLSLFSYPLQYPPVWLLLIFIALSLFKKNIPQQMPVYIKATLTVFCIAIIGLLSYKMYNELQWNKIATQSLQGKTKQMLPHYQKLYPRLKHNAYFLYNYGAELNVAKKYQQSNEVLNECVKQFNDYDLQLLIADNYTKLDSTKLSLETYKKATNMIPCRFLPLYKQFEIHIKENNQEEALQVAKNIQSKSVKVPSATVNYIKNKVDKYIETYE